MKLDILKKIMYANSIAVVGASNKPASVGNEVMKRLLGYGFKGQIYPINPKDDMIEGIKAYKSVCDIKKPVDFAVIAVPAKAILSVVDECHEAKIDGLVVITAGFKEIGGEGALLEKELAEKVKKYNMGMIGPNCLGIINTNEKLNASFNPVSPKGSGKVAFVSQSGAIACGIINLLEKRNFGFTQVVSIGNQADIDFLDLIEFWENDDNVEIIMAYIEGIADAVKFRDICSRVSKKKPIIMLKSGRSAKGSTATASHTGTLAGDDISLDAVIKSSGVIRELYLRDFLNTVQIFNNCPMPKGNKLGILTNAGGPGIIATDTASDLGLEVATLSEETKAKLRENLPIQASVKNPVDIIASASLEQFKTSADILLSSNEIDILLVIYLYIQVKNDTNLAIELDKLKAKYPNKTIIAVFQTSKTFFDELSCENITVPVLHYGVDALSGIKKLLVRSEFLAQKEKDIPKIKIDKKATQLILNNSKAENRKLLTTYESLKIFECFNLPLAKFVLAKNFDDAKQFASENGYPIVLKISSKTITHKTDIGGVVVNILNEKQLETEWNNLVQRLKNNNVYESLDGIIVMEQIKHTAREFVGGIVKKNSVGHLAMFGLGGIFVETLKEVAFAPCPLKITDAERLINSTKCASLLGNVRDYKAVDKELFAQNLVAMSKIVEEFPEISEIDINPLIADKNGDIKIVDARIIL